MILRKNLKSYHFLVHVYLYSICKWFYLIFLWSPKKYSTAWEITQKRPVKEMKFKEVKLSEVTESLVVEAQLLARSSGSKSHA